MDITKFTIEQLKALAYDLMIVVQQNQNNIRIIEAELQKRQAATPPNSEPALNS